MAKRVVCLTDPGWAGLGLGILAAATTCPTTSSGSRGAAVQAATAIHRHRRVRSEASCILQQIQKQGSNPVTLCLVKVQSGDNFEVAQGKHQGCCYSGIDVRDEADENWMATDPKSQKYLGSWMRQGLHPIYLSPDPSIGPEK